MSKEVETPFKGLVWRGNKLVCRLCNKVLGEVIPVGLYNIVRILGDCKHFEWWYVTVGYWNLVYMKVEGWVLTEEDYPYLTILVKK